MQHAVADVVVDYTEEVDELLMEMNKNDFEGDLSVQCFFVNSMDSTKKVHTCVYVCVYDPPRPPLAESEWG